MTFLPLNQVEDLTLLAGDHKEAWRLLGICSAVDPDLHFEEETVEVAKNLCHDCPVEDVCLEHALINDEPWGVWGGMSPRERDEYRTEWELSRGKKGLAESRKRFGLTRDDSERYELRLGKARAARRCVNYGDGFDEHVEVLDLLVRNPYVPCASLAQRIGKSRTWFEKRFNEICFLLSDDILKVDNVEAHSVSPSPAILPANPNRETGGGLA